MARPDVPVWLLALRLNLSTPHLQAGIREKKNASTTFPQLQRADQSAQLDQGKVSNRLELTLRWQNTLSQ